MRLLPLLAAALALALYGGGCGSSATALDPVAQAAQTTSQAGGAHIALSIQVSATGLPGAFAVNGEGFFNYHTQEGVLSLDTNGASPSAALPTGPLRIEEIFKSGAVYVSSPLLAGKLPGGARWMKLDIARFAQAAGLDLQQLTGGQANPAQFLQYLRAVAGTPTRVGSELVRGVVTTHYHATVDLDKLAGVLGGGSGGALHAALSKLVAQLGASELPLDVWVDGHGLVRRVALALSVPTGAGRAHVAVTLELFGFGATPSLSAPPRGEVFDATQTALGALGTSGG
jgi:hypothetical protein